MITGFGDIKSAVESMKPGARAYVTKPFKLEELLALARQIIEEKNRDASGKIKSESDVLALKIHIGSKRNNKPFVTLDCGLLSHNLAESELYGHKKGAFSGASEGKVGLVEKSDQGTLFLDEIGNIDLELQKKFLRFLETRRFRKVGETAETKVDTRIVLATNLDLHEAAQKGEMRKDLLYRMDVISIKVPPLRERPEDIALLAQYFLDIHKDRRKSMKLTDDALDALSRYSWPGNVRELKSVINKTVIMADNEEITPDDLPSHLNAHKEAAVVRSKSLADIEKAHIVAVLEETGGNQSKTAEILGINRKTLYKKIHKFHIFA